MKTAREIRCGGAGKEARGGRRECTLVHDRAPPPPLPADAASAVATVSAPDASPSLLPNLSPCPSRRSSTPCFPLPAPPQTPTGRPASPDGPSLCIHI
nr:hypothetical protein RVX_2852 [Nitratidesulfovibrio sp. HK-II]